MRAGRRSRSIYLKYFFASYKVDVGFEIILQNIFLATINPLDPIPIRLQY